MNRRTSFRATDVRIAEWQLFVLIFILAFLLRVFALSRYWSDLNLDPDVYLALAQGLADGRGYSAPGTDIPTAFRPPLYPLLLMGVSAPDQKLGRALLQLVLSLATIPVIWLTARNLGLSRIGRLFATACLAVDPLLIRYVPYPMTETFCGLLIACLLLCVTRSGPATWKSGFVTGITFGLCVLSRPTFWAAGFLFGAAALLHLWLDRAKLGAESKMRRTSQWNSLIAVLVGVALCVTPWVVRNAIQLKSPILMTTHGGYTLLLGNNDAFYEEVVRQPFGTIWDGSRGPGQNAWVTQINQEMEAQSIRSEIEQDRWMSQRAWSTIFAQPATAIQAALLKFCWFWNIAPHAAADQTTPQAVRWVVSLYYSGLWLCLIAGILNQIRRIRLDESANRGWEYPLLLILAMSLAHLLYWSDARMRAPVMPAVALLAASGAGVLWRRVLPVSSLADRESIPPAQ